MTQLEKFTTSIIKTIDFFSPLSINYLAANDAFAYLSHIDENNNFIEVWISRNIFGRLKFKCDVSNFVLVKGVRPALTLIEKVKLTDLETESNKLILNQIKRLWNESKVVKGDN